jgi:hypothetical protein
MNNQKFLEHYRKDKTVVWIKLKLTNGQEFYFNEYKMWIDVKRYCEARSVFIEEFCLQFRSHEVKIDIPDADGIYFIRSILGQMGGDSKHYYTVGVIKDSVVHKKMWITPELIEEKVYEDDIDSCFEEGIIYDDRKTKKNRQK